MKRSARAVLSAGLIAVMPLAAGAETACGPNAPLGQAVTLEYGVTATRAVLSLSGEGMVAYRRKGDSYTMESLLQAAGIIEARQSSVGTVSREGLVPRTFTQRSSSRPPRSAEFDWAAQRVTFGQSGTSAPTRPQMQDRLSLLMQLPWRHRADPRATIIELPVAGQGGTSTYTFKAQGSATLFLPAGRFDTVKFERHKQDGDEALEVWLAPDLCSLPVRLRFVDDKGLVIEQQLRAVRTAPR
jgi:hypothetical protein